MNKYTAEEVIKKIAECAIEVAGCAGVGAVETAGAIISGLSSEEFSQHSDGFMSGELSFTELWELGALKPENGTLSFMAISGKIVDPSELKDLINKRDKKS